MKVKMRIAEDGGYVEGKRGCQTKVCILLEADKNGRYQGVAKQVRCVHNLTHTQETTPS